MLSVLITLYSIVHKFRNKAERVFIIIIIIIIDNNNEFHRTASLKQNFRATVCPV